MPGKGKQKPAGQPTSDEEVEEKKEETPGPPAPPVVHVVPPANANVVNGPPVLQPPKSISHAGTVMERPWSMFHSVISWTNPLGQISNVP